MYEEYFSALLHVEHVREARMAARKMPVAGEWNYGAIVREKVRESL